MIRQKWFKGETFVDGLKVAYAVIGDSSLRTPILYHHGFPGSSMEGLVALRRASAAGVSVISIDRPGLGRSEFLRDRTLLDWPRIAQGVSDHLGISSFHVIGVSGGAPYALSTAFAIPERVRNVAIVSGIGEIAGNPALLDGMTAGNRMLLRLADRLPMAAELSVTAMALLWKTIPALGLIWLQLGMEKSDREKLSEDSTREFVGGS